MLEMVFLSGVLLGVQFISRTGVLPLNGGSAAASCTMHAGSCNYVSTTQVQEVLTHFL